MKSLNLVVSLMLTTGLYMPLQAATTTGAKASAHPLMHAVNIRLKAEWSEIQAGEKSGKISKTQADSLRAQLKTIRTQEVTFMKQDGNHEITTDQQTQLDALLDTNEKAISSN